MKAADAIHLAGLHRAVRDFPRPGDPRAPGNHLFPVPRPSFRVDWAARPAVFTIGSCFARNIEEALEPLGVALPTRAFAVPREEWPNRPNGLLNEFNPGSIAQRIRFALDGTDYPDETLAPVLRGVADLALPGGGAPVTLERARQRRAEIAEVYRHLAQARLVVITLGLVEAWRDLRTGAYLNQMPPTPVWQREPGRFELRRMGVEECLRLLRYALLRLRRAGPDVVLTVSPVPLQTTFSGEDCITANQYAKSVLRVVADELCRTIRNVDYFPSYEMVVSGGAASFEPDRVHVRDSLVREITGRMVAAYAMRD